METRDEAAEVFAMGLERLESLARAAGAVEITPSREISGEEIGRRIEEGFGLLVGCSLHFEALSAAGLTEEETRRLRALLEGMKSAEAIYLSRRTKRAEEVRARLHDALCDAMGRLRARAVLAFRFDSGNARLRSFTSSFAPRSETRRSPRSLRHAVELKLR